MIFKIEKRRFRQGGKLLETRSYYLRYRIGDMPVDKWVSREDLFEQEIAARPAATKRIEPRISDRTMDEPTRGRRGRGGQKEELLFSALSALSCSAISSDPCHLPSVVKIFAKRRDADGLQRAQRFSFRFSPVAYRPSHSFTNLRREESGGPRRRSPLSHES